MSFTDDASNEETLISAATAAVATLTASSHEVPSAHDGETVFTFELHFSEEFDLSYQVLRDHAFTVTGGQITKAKRLDRGRAARG